MKELKEELISFETAKLAKEKGFQVDRDNCKSEYYLPDCTLINPINQGVESVKLYPSEYEAPTQSLLQRWLREIHRVNVFCAPNKFDSDIWYWFLGYNGLIKSDKTQTYEQALEKGLQEGLKLIKII